MTQIRFASRLQTMSLCLAVLAMLTFPTAAESRTTPMVVLGPAGAEVIVNGVSAGILPFDEPLDLEPGHHVIHCDLRGYEPFARSLEIDDQNTELRLRIRLTPYRLRSALTGNLLLAGAGNRYLGYDRSGWTWTAVEIGGVLTAIWGELLFRNFESDYEIAYAAYREDISATNAQEQRLACEEAWSNMKDAESLRRNGLIAAGAAIVISMVDVWLRFPSFDAGSGIVPSEAQAGAAHDTGIGVHAGWQVSFQ